MKHQTAKFVLCILALSLLVSCGQPKPIKIGFAGEFTKSPARDLAIDGLDAAQLAVDEINRQGGINGRLLVLVVKDDEGDPDLARKVNAELVAEGVVAILGHTTSSPTAAVFEQVNQGHTIMMTLAASDQFTGQADNVFRVFPHTTTQGQALADHIYKNRGIRHLTGLYDLKREAYAKSLWDALKVRFEELGGETDQVFTFTPDETDLAALMTEIKATNPEALFLIAAAPDTALLTQYIHQQELEVPLFSSGLAQYPELLQKGGQTVEGLEMGAVFVPENPYPRFKPFVDAYQNKYHRLPSAITPYQYEAVLVLAEALKQTGGEPQGLPEALINIKNLPGVQGVISLDKYGDVQRDLYIVVVKDGEFELVTAITPTPTSD